MWEIRKVYVAQIRPYGVNAVAYVGEDEQRANEIVDRLRSDMRPDPLSFGPPPRGPHVETWMVAVRFEGGKVVEIQGLAQCRPPDFGDPFLRAEIDIARSA